MTTPTMELHRLSDDFARELCPVFHPSEDELILYSSSNNTLVTISSRTSSFLSRSSTLPTPIIKVLVHPSSTSQIVLIAKNAVYLYNLRSQAVMKTILHNQASIIDAIYSSETELIVLQSPINNQEEASIIKISLVHGDLEGQSETIVALKTSTDSPHLLLHAGIIYVSDGKLLHLIRPGSPTITTRHSCTITALAAQRRGGYLALGDINGAILLFPTPPARPLLRECNAARMHWHAGPVTALSVGEEALLSGGEEGVLLTWNLVTRQPHFLPRLGGPIAAIARGRRGVLAATLETNEVVLIDGPSNKIVGRRAGLSDSSLPCYRPRPLRPGMLAMGAGLLLPGAPGSLQHIRTSGHDGMTQSKTIRVVSRNLLRTASRRGALQGPAVSRVAAGDGWMAALDTMTTPSGPVEETLQLFSVSETGELPATADVSVPRPHVDPIVLLLGQGSTLLTSSKSELRLYGVVKEEFEEAIEEGADRPPTSVCLELMSVHTFGASQVLTGALAPDASLLHLLTREGTHCSLQALSLPHLTPLLTVPLPFQPAGKAAWARADGEAVWVGDSKRAATFGLLSGSIRLFQAKDGANITAVGTSTPAGIPVCISRSGETQVILVCHDACTALANYRLDTATGVVLQGEDLWLLGRADGHRVLLGSEHPVREADAAEGDIEERPFAALSFEAHRVIARDIEVAESHGAVFSELRSFALPPASLLLEPFMDILGKQPQPE
eukprot:gnl/Dysnectes_brevis/1195_a1336_1862.p1 GENE.gnl/Dysnectes_brevis/1195_a1336_1862~~gnl/Dysnectes_brevis/1195_a1336_1862.p1  ORF type:complete len:727 (+),score=171.37 gnl/Dysnectes_brevis/1195_a1336_1862:37-2217(+)